jgi:hypothetical protein
MVERVLPDLLVIPGIPVGRVVEPNTQECGDNDRKENCQCKGSGGEIRMSKRKLNCFSSRKNTEMAQQTIQLAVLHACTLLDTTGIRVRDQVISGSSVL